MRTMTETATHWSWTERSDTPEPCYRCGSLTTRINGYGTEGTLPYTQPFCDDCEHAVVEYAEAFDRWLDEEAERWGWPEGSELVEEER